MQLVQTGSCFYWKRTVTLQLFYIVYLDKQHTSTCRIAGTGKIYYPRQQTTSLHLQQITCGTVPILHTNSGKNILKIPCFFWYDFRSLADMNYQQMQQTLGLDPRSSSSQQQQQATTTLVTTTTAAVSAAVATPTNLSQDLRCDYCPDRRLS